MMILFLPAQTMAEEVSSVLQNELAPIEELSELNNTAPSQAVDNDNNVSNVSKESVQVNSPIPHKNPISKRKLVKKFLFAMLAVGLSSFALYFGLTIYNKFKMPAEPKVKTPSGETALTTPKDFESATKTFFEKTKW